MFKVSEATAIALHSVIYIAGKGDGISSLKEISQKFSVSDNHLSKVLQRLVKEGIISSSKGPKGGFTIVPEYKNITFLEIYEIIEGKFKVNNCLFTSNSNNCSNCIMGDILSKINNDFVDYMKNHKISDFSL